VPVAFTGASGSVSVAQLLKQTIDQFAFPYGATKTGADWCIKALHPSDPMTEVRGIPDNSAVPSLLMNYQSTFTLSPTPGAVGTWSFNAALLPHPINFMYIDEVDSLTAPGIESNFMNTQMAGVTHSDKYNAFRTMVQRWRLAYMSVTVYQDGPDLANQGTIVVAQGPVMPLHYNFCYPTSGSTKLISMPAIEQYTNEDHPDFTTSQGMPNAYFSRSREGAYVPLKLTETCQDWVSDADRITPAAIMELVAGQGEEILPVAPNVPGYPHVNIPSAYYSSGVSKSYPTSPMLNGTWAFLCARNLALTTSFTFFVRCGIEMQVVPSSVLAPQLKLSPPQDEAAIRTYFAIARELKDGYPADYNDAGKIWDAISSTVKKILPFAENIPGIGGAARAVSGMMTMGDKIRASRQKKKKGPSKSAPKKR
jgi:hypothetical protein